MASFILLVLVIWALVDQDKLAREIRTYNQNSEKVLQIIEGRSSPKVIEVEPHEGD